MKNCAWCNAEFTPIGRQLYCTRACRARRYRYSPGGRTMTALYERSDARRASYRRWYDTEGGRASRARHEATRGYLRKRTKQLIASRSRTAAQIAALEQEAKCQRQ